MTLDETKRAIQAAFSDDIAVIVGSGVSCSEGIPGMKEISRHLASSLPRTLNHKQLAEWTPISEDLRKGENLEQALAHFTVGEQLYALITNEVGGYVRSREKVVMNEVVAGTRQLRFATLMKAFPPSPNGIPIITTNYDRLIELACDISNHPVDTMFVGSVFQHLNPRQSAFSFCRGIRRRQGKFVLEYAPRYRILKPHGSLDWYQMDGQPIRCDHELEQPPLIIAPGNLKYRAGYDEPFDISREHANREINRVSKYIILGYGFNDDHLQVHLSKNLRAGKHALIVTQSLTDAARRIIDDSPNVLSLSEHLHDPGKCTFRNVDGVTQEIDRPYWDIETLAKETLL